MLDAFFNKKLSFRIICGCTFACIVSFIVFAILYSIAPESNGLNGIALLSKPVLSDYERWCILYMLSLQTICIFLIPAYIIIIAIYRKPADILRLQGYTNKHISTTVLLISILLLTISNLPCVNLLSDINIKGVRTIVGENSIHWLNYQRLEAMTENLLSNEMLLPSLLCMAIIPAVSEELFFRGFLQTVATQVFKNKHIAILTIAAIFSILHGDMFNILPRFLLGAYLGYLFASTKNIYYSILAHTCHNATVVLFSKQFKLPEDIETMGTLDNNALLGIASLLILLGFIIYLTKQNKTPQSPIA